MVEEYLDLYEIIISVDTQKERARIEKYRVKKTGKNFLPQRIAGDLEGKGYSHRMSSRLPVSNLMRLSHSFFLGTDHVYVSIFCLHKQRAAALEKAKAEVDATVKRYLKNAQALNDVWANRENTIHERKPGEPPVQYADNLV